MQRVYRISLLIFCLFALFTNSNLALADLCTDPGSTQFLIGHGYFMSESASDALLVADNFAENEYAAHIVDVAYSLACAPSCEPDYNSLNHIIFNIQESDLEQDCSPIATLEDYQNSDGPGPDANWLPWCAEFKLNEELVDTYQEGLEVCEEEGQPWNPDPVFNFAAHCFKSGTVHVQLKCIPSDNGTTPGGDDDEPSDSLLQPDHRGCATTGCEDNDEPHTTIPAARPPQFDGDGEAPTGAISPH